MLSIQLIPIVSFILAASLFFKRKILATYVGLENIQFILIFSVTLFVYSILGLVLSFISQPIYFIIWCLILIIFIATIVYAIRRLGQEEQEKKNKK